MRAATSKESDAVRDPYASFAGQQHTFQMAAGHAPEADDAIREQAEWVRPKLGLASS